MVRAVVNLELINIFGGVFLLSINGEEESFWISTIHLVMIPANCCEATEKSTALRFDNSDGGSSHVTVVMEV
jgi:hypothetical protein